MVFTTAPSVTVIFLGDSLRRVRAFGRPVRLALGRELRLLQLGEEPRRWKPMPSVGPSVCEIRVSILGEYRVLYVRRSKSVLYVLHAFQKKTQRTRQADMALARLRLRDI